ncbi:MAG: DUF2779 domain-containing protein [Acidobacteriota bacterium]
MSQPRYLTKSRFKIAMQCPTKLFYTNKAEYANSKLDDPFLAALADGGFQVGELAKCYFPGGVEVSTLDYDESVRQTEELLKRESVTIFEGAFRYENFFIRADVVVKNGNAIELIEVKAKSCDFDDETGCHNKNGSISSNWKPYIEDVAFQKYVVRNAHPEFKVTAHLMLSDKTSLCGTDGLNQKFRLVTGENNRKRVEVSNELTDADLETKILRQICVDASCEKIYAEVEETRPVGRVQGYADMLNTLSQHYAADTKIPPVPGTICSNCEFQDDSGEAKSGFRECWTEIYKWSDKDFDDASILDLWNFSRKDELMAAGKLKLSQLLPDDIAPKTKPKGEPKAGLSTTDRQWEQIQKATNRDETPYVDLENLKQEFGSWAYPLHFIDFETAAPVIPFQRGRRPYEGVAFQFSHHTVDEQGRIEHCGEFLHTTRGTFPNYDFIRELKRQLECDRGTVFRYHSHENSYLCAIRQQLLNDASDIADRDELVAFIETISKPRDKNPIDTWQAGPRNMVDLFELVKRYYYHPATRGSISLKYVLPAVLGTSKFLQEKYSQPIYGADGGIKSLNFKDWSWVVRDETASVGDPYRLLEPLFTDESEHDIAIIHSAWYDEVIRDGGAAMTAYAKLQFQEMPPEIRTAMNRALKRYCELDTLAMVMIYEAWRAELR